MPKKNPLKSVSTGPKSKAGKSRSSRNAIKHGLTAKNWLDEAEQEQYQSLLTAFREEYQPQTATEEMLVERVANLATRSSRFHRVEDGLFQLARHKATEFESIKDSFGIDDEVVADAVAIANGIYDPTIEVDKALMVEIMGIKNSEEITGYNYVLENLPELRRKLISDCRSERCDIKQLIGGKGSPNQDKYKPKFTIRWANEDGTYSDDAQESSEPSDEELDKSGLDVSALDIRAYIREQHLKILRQLQLNEFITNYKQRGQLLVNSAMPPPGEMDRLMRYQTTNERQLSKALGELLHVIEKRERKQAI